MSDEDAEAATEEVVLKIVVCGDGSSGKTSLCQRFVKDSFERSYHQTLGLDFFSKRISLPGDVEVLMQVWDIGGQSIAGEMIDKYIYGSHAALVVYDVTNMNSFDNCQDWLNVIRRVTKSQEKPPHVFIVGNKVDEERLRKVPVDAHCAFAKRHDLKAFYVSAKTGDSVTMMFRQVAADVLRIVLTRVEQEADIAIVQGEVSHEVKEPRRRHIDQSKNTAVCSIQ